MSDRYFMDDKHEFKGECCDIEWFDPDCTFWFDPDDKNMPESNPHHCPPSPPKHECKLRCFVCCFPCFSQDDWDKQDSYDSKEKDKERKPEKDRCEECFKRFDCCKFSCDHNSKKRNTGARCCDDFSKKKENY